VKPGFTLFVPAYWWYSIEFTDVYSQVNSATYSTPANLLSNSRHFALYFLQQQNATQFFLKPLPTENSLVDISHVDVVSVGFSSANVEKPTEIDEVVESILADLKGSG
jgi:hypothetical protein